MSDNFGETRPVDLESDWRRDESADVALDVADDVDCRAVLQMGLGYAAVVLGLGRLLPQGSSLVVPGATLAVAAVFQPARRRIQQGVDRRFNRRRHDAARTIEAFGVRLRDQVDLDGLRASCWGGRGHHAADPGVAVAAAAAGAGQQLTAEASPHSATLRPARS